MALEDYIRDFFVMTPDQKARLAELGKPTVVIAKGAPEEELAWTVQWIHRVLAGAALEGPRAMTLSLMGLSGSWATKAGEEPVWWWPGRLARVGAGQLLDDLTQRQALEAYDQTGLVLTEAQAVDWRAVCGLDD